MTKIFVITEQNTDRGIDKEWDYWCKAKDENTLFINNDGIYEKQYSENIKLIVLNGLGGRGQFKNTWEAIPFVDKKSIKFVCHGNFKVFTMIITQDLINEKPKYYSIHQKTTPARELWDKILKDIATAVRDEKCDVFKEKFNQFVAICNEQKNIEDFLWPYPSTINKVLRSFLPLDIDMQALTDKKVDKEKYLQEMAEDLDELYSSKEKKNIHYRRKLYDLWYLLGQEAWLEQNKLEYSPELKHFTLVEKPTKELCKFACINSGKQDLPFQIHDFLMMLDTATIENKLKEIYKQRNIIVEDKKNNKTEEITTFHEWYIKLCEYLKMYEV